MIEHLPRELRDSFTEMREIDLQVHSKSAGLDIAIGKWGRGEDSGLKQKLARVSRVEDSLLKSRPLEWIVCDIFWIRF